MIHNLEIDVHKSVEKKQKKVIRILTNNWCLCFFFFFVRHLFARLCQIRSNPRTLKPLPSGFWSAVSLCLMVIALPIDLLSITSIGVNYLRLASRRDILSRYVSIPAPFFKPFTRRPRQSRWRLRIHHHFLKAFANVDLRKTPAPQSSRHVWAFGSLVGTLGDTD